MVGSLVIFLLLCLKTYPVYSKHILSVCKTGENRDDYSLHEGVADNHVVWASYDDHISSTGWSYLEIHGNASSPSHDMAYFAGLLEGMLTAEYIYQQYHNTLAGYCVNETDYCGQLALFLERNQQYMSKMMAELDHEPFWYQVNLFLDQLDGLRDGYILSESPDIPDIVFWYFQISGGLDDFEAALGKNDSEQRIVGSGSCSALIKLLTDNKELYVAHDTWNEYQEMIRIFKYYDLPYSVTSYGRHKVVGSIQSFSSYPGLLYSGDDYYQLSSNLVTIETTHGNYNDKLWKYVSPHSVLEGIRTMVANRLATNGSEWCHYFAQNNSGTYNNEWMIVDYKLFEPGKELVNNTLWVLEQLPGEIHSDDVTNVLKSQGYWASYNIPYFDDIFKDSGFAQLADQYGPWFTHSGSPRTKIFARDQHKIVDIDSMMYMMRYNDFKHDPLSACNCTPPYSAENAISARSDLNSPNGTYPFSALSHRLHGGTDMKLTSLELHHTNFTCIAISGPTYQQQPPFKWSTSGYSPIPLGHPDLWQFDPVKVSWPNK